MTRTRCRAALLAALALTALAGCGGSGGAAGRADRTGHGYATGIVLDTRGEPIAGARILLDNTVFHASYISGSTGADGSYRIRVQPGAWRTHANFRKEYNGTSYFLELHPDNIDSFDDSGAERNFIWKLQGRKPDNDHGHYGGLVKVYTDYGFYEDLEQIQLTLTPSGPLIDGSHGQPLVLRLHDHYWVQREYVEDVPIGRYVATAVLHGADGPTPLRLRDGDADGEPVPKLEFDFKPDSSGSPGATASIVLGH